MAFSASSRAGIRRLACRGNAWWWRGLRSWQFPRTFVGQALVEAGNAAFGIGLARAGIDQWKRSIQPRQQVAALHVGGDQDVASLIRDQRLATTERGDVLGMFAVA